MFHFFTCQPRAMRWRLYLALAMAVAALGYRFHFSTLAVAIWATRFAGYWLAALTAALFVLTLKDEVRAHWPGWRRLRPHWPGLLVAILGAVFWQVHEPRDFKVLFDEHVLAGMARSMHYERESSYDSYLHFIDGHLVGLGQAVDKRPLMFPFLVSVMHDLTGYRPENSFVVNGLLGFVLLLLIYGLGAAVGGWRVGCLGQFLLIGLPLLAQSATGGGFDLLNATMLCAFLLTAWNYWRQPGTGGLDLCVFTGLVLGNCRYESLLYLGILGLLVACKWVRERELSLTMVSALAPLLALPPMLIHKVFTTGGSNYQTSRDNFLNIAHVPDNFSHAVYFLFMPSFGLNNSLLLSAVGVVAMLFTLVGVLLRLRSAARKPGLELPLLLVVLGVLAGTFIEFNLSWGHWEDPVVVRFSLPLQIAFVWCAMFVAAQMFRSRRLPNWLLGGAAIYAVVAAAPISSQAVMTHQHPTYLAYHWAAQYVTKHADESVLIVSRASLLFTVLNQPNIHMGVANAAPEKVFNSIKLGFYHEVWVIQECMLNQRLNAWVEYPPARLDQRLILEPIAEFSFLRESRLRISRVVGFDPSRPAGTVVLWGELHGDTDSINKGLGGDYANPTSSDNLLTERPEGQPPAIESMSQLPANGTDMVQLLLKQYPVY